MSPDNPFDADLMVAWYMARGDEKALAEVARGETQRDYTAEQRGQAFIALGDFPAAREQFEQATLDTNAELIDLITDDWIWRLPHVINRAHLWFQAGDVRGEEELERLLLEFRKIGEQGIVNPLANYWAAGANAVLGRTRQAHEMLDKARQTGWHHPWWERLDWNIRFLT